METTKRKIRYIYNQQLNKSPLREAAERYEQGSKNRNLNNNSMIEAEGFLQKKGIEVKSLISKFEIEKEFSSHDFIEKLTEKYESEYIEMLVEHKDSGKSFQTVHRLIAKYLSHNTVNLGLEKTERKESENVRGNLDVIQWWKRIN